MLFMFTLNLYLCKDTYIIKMILYI
jgi:hypothetical protein